MISDKAKARILFLWLDCKQFHASYASRRGVKVANVFRRTPDLLKIIRRGQIKYNLFSIYPWLDSWANELENYDTVILHASKLTPPVVKYINKVKPKIRVIVWYWNPVEKSEKIKSFLSKDCEVWTFDEDDALRYKIKHNTQYYFNNIVLKDMDVSIDTLFVGGDKGRLRFLIETQSEFQRLGLKVNFHIVGTSSLSRGNSVYKKRINYSEILDKISKSKAIVDIVSEKQTGLTLRPLEALFFKKKLITNDRNIFNRDFYSSNNVFVLGHDCIEGLSEFLNKPYESKNEISERYDFDQWLSRFFSE